MEPRDLYPRDLSRHPEAFPNSPKIPIFTAFERKTPKFLSANALNINLHFSRKSGLYRYSFNGKEKDNESFQGAYDFGARIYDGRLGRWWSVDPKSFVISSHTTYMFGGDNPLFYLDPEGETIIGFLGLRNGIGSISRALKIASESSVFTNFLKQFNKVGNGDQISSEDGRYASLNINFEKREAQGELVMGLNQVEIFDASKQSWISLDKFQGDLSNISKNDIRMNIILYENIGSNASAINTVLHETILHGETTAELLASFVNASAGENVDLRDFKNQYLEKTNSELDHYKIENGESELYTTAQIQVQEYLSKSPCPQNTQMVVPKHEIQRNIDSYTDVNLSHKERSGLHKGVITLCMEFKLYVHTERTFTYDTDHCGEIGNMLCPKD